MLSNLTKTINSVIEFTYPMVIISLVVIVGCAPLITKSVDVFRNKINKKFNIETL